MPIMIDIVAEPAPLLRRPVVLVAILGALVVLVAALSLLHLRREAIDTQGRELRLLSLALTAEVGRGLQGIDEGFRAMQVELSEGRLPTSGTLAGRILKTHADLLPLVQTLWLLDGQGKVLAASEASAPPPLASFAPATDSLQDGQIAVSRPFPLAMALPSAHVQTMVALAVRYPAQAQQGSGWIVAAMPADALLGAFSVATPAPDARMAVFRKDGVRLAGAIVATPHSSEANMARRLAAMRSAAVRHFRDDSERLVAMHSLQQFGLDVVLTRDLGVMLVGWRQAVRIVLLVVAFLLLVISGATGLIVRANRRRALAQQALQAQQARSSKFNSLGVLAGAVAHDFNNVLASIVGYGEMAQDAAVPGSAQRRHLDMVIKAALRGKTLVERILSFSGGGARASTSFALEPIVEEVLAMLEGSLSAGITLKQQLQAAGGQLNGDPTQAFEAVMNLCTNAIQAMPGGGTLTVDLRRVHMVQARILSHSRLEAGSYLALAVADEGGGISASVMEHLFEPFFTTRAAQLGTGLGLAVVHGVVTEFGGAIDVASEPGHGSLFTVYFPEYVGAAAPQPLAPDSQPGASQTIMVIDDDADLVAMLSEMLTDLGYAPIGYSEPALALQALLGAPEKYALVITDEVMPGMSGTLLAQTLSAQRPGLPLILLSGYGGPLMAAKAVTAGVSQVMLKPVRRDELAQVLQTLLQGKHTA